MSALRWTLKSTYELARDLQAWGFRASAELVRRLLHQLVGADGPSTLPRGHHVVDHRRCRRLQWPRVRAWKWHLATLAAETGLAITVCHYPPGTSKWNKAA